jgi:hypothetical protein
LFEKVPGAEPLSEPFLRDLDLIWRVDFRKLQEILIRNEYSTLMNVLTPNKPVEAEKPEMSLSDD